MGTFTRKAEDQTNKSKSWEKRQCQESLHLGDIEELDNPVAIDIYAKVHILKTKNQEGIPKWNSDFKRWTH